MLPSWIHSVFICFLTIILQIVAVIAFFVGASRFVRDDPKPLPPDASRECCVVYHIKQYTQEDWRDVKRILMIFIGLPVYWALFYQQNSTWVNQATEMDLTAVAGTAGMLR